MQKFQCKSATCFLIAILTVLGSTTTPRTAQAGLLGGAIGGAVLGGIIGGGRGAGVGAVIGGIGGAVHENDRRRRAYEQQQAYYQQQQLAQQQRENERLRMERDRNRALQQQTAANSPQTKTTMQIQSALTLMGFDVGAANGNLNQATVEAIRAYQSSYGLLATGQPSDELLSHMRKNL